jgi:hypothetical protein
MLDIENAKCSAFILLVYIMLNNLIWAFPALFVNLIYAAPYYYSTDALENQTDSPQQESGRNSAKLWGLWLCYSLCLLFNIIIIFASEFPYTVTKEYLFCYRLLQT